MVSHSTRCPQLQEAARPLTYRRVISAASNINRHSPSSPSHLFRSITASRLGFLVPSWTMNYASSPHQLLNQLLERKIKAVPGFMRLDFRELLPRRGCRPPSLRFRGAAKDLSSAAAISRPVLCRHSNRSPCLADAVKGWAKTSRPILPLTLRYKFGDRSPLLSPCLLFEWKSTSRAAPKSSAWFSSTQPGHDLQAEG